MALECCAANPDAVKVAGDNIDAILVSNTSNLRSHDEVRERANAIAEPDANKPGGKVKTISVANEFAECIYNVFMSRPVSGIFGGNSTI